MHKEELIKEVVTTVGSVVRNIVNDTKFSANEDRVKDQLEQHISRSPKAELKEICEALTDYGFKNTYLSNPDMESCWKFIISDLIAKPRNELSEWPGLLVSILNYSQVKGDLSNLAVEKIEKILQYTLYLPTMIDEVINEPSKPQPSEYQKRSTPKANAKPGNFINKRSLNENFSNTLSTAKTIVEPEKSTTNKDDFLDFPYLDENVSNSLLSHEELAELDMMNIDDILQLGDIPSLDENLSNTLPAAKKLAEPKNSNTASKDTNVPEVRMTPAGSVLGKREYPSEKELTNLIDLTKNSKNTNKKNRVSVSSSSKPATLVHGIMTAEKNNQKPSNIITNTNEKKTATGSVSSKTIFFEDKNVTKTLKSKKSNNLSLVELNNSTALSK